MKYLGFILVLLVSCTNPNKNGRENIINISIKAQEIESSLSEISKEAFLIKINDAKIGRIEEIQVTKNGLFILAQNGLFRFDHKGEYINQIGSYGKGPGEYSRLVNFTIDNEKQNVYLLGGNQILKYTFEGEFLKSTSPVNGLNRLIFYNDQVVGSYAIINPGMLNNVSIPALLILSDELEVIENKMIQESNSHISQMFAYSATLYTYDDQLIYHSPFSDTIFSIKESHESISYLINIEANLKSEYPDLFVQNIVESDKFVYCNIILSNKLKLFAYQKGDGSTYLINASKPVNKAGFNDDFFHLPPFVPKFFKNTEYAADFFYGFELKSKPVLKELNLYETDIIIRVIKL